MVYTKLSAVVQATGRLKMFTTGEPGRTSFTVSFYKSQATTLLLCNYTQYGGNHCIVHLATFDFYVVRNKIKMSDTYNAPNRALLEILKSRWRMKLN